MLLFQCDKKWVKASLVLHMRELKEDNRRTTKNAEQYGVCEGSPVGVQWVVCEGSPVGVQWVNKNI